MQPSRLNRIKTLVNAQFAPTFLEVHNESHGHQVPVGSETHFKLIIASPHFEKLSLLARHKLVYQHLKSELDSGLHALSLHTYTPEEWQQQSTIPASPKCAHQHHTHER